MSSRMLTKKLLSLSDTEVHPSKCFRFCKKNLTRTKVPGISLFAVSKNKELVVFLWEDRLVLANIIALFGHKRARHEALSQVSCRSCAATIARTELIFQHERDFQQTC